MRIPYRRFEPQAPNHAPNTSHNVCVAGRPARSRTVAEQSGLVPRPQTRRGATVRVSSVSVQALPSCALRVAAAGGWRRSSVLGSGAWPRRRRDRRRGWWPARSAPGIARLAYVRRGGQTADASSTRAACHHAPASLDAPWLGWQLLPRLHITRLSTPPRSGRPRRPPPWRLLRLRQLWASRTD